MSIGSLCIAELDIRCTFVIMSVKNMENTTNKLSCFTIGHSTHEIDSFINLLQLNGVEWLVDVRSIPYSQHNPQYNKENLKTDLGKSHISYVHMGNLLGARHSNPNLYFDDKEMVDFKKVRDSDGFKHGIDKIVNGVSKGFNICLMCSEKDPFDCHRFVLISYALEKKGVTVKHILENGDVITNQVLEERMLLKYKIEYGKATLFEMGKTREEAVEEGYEKRNHDIGYIKADVASIS